MEKRGLSAIVATLLIILLTLIAVGIVWVVIQNVIRQGAEQVEIGAYTLDLQIQSAKVENGNVILVVVRRNPGQGEFIGMNFVFSDGQNSETKRENVSLGEGDTRSFTFTLTQVNTASLKTVSVYPIYRLSSGRETMGNVADEFDVPENKSIGGGTGEVEISNFEALGFTGAGRVAYPGGGDKIPQFTNVIIDPLDVHLGDNQTFTAYVSSPNEIIEVTTKTQLDNELLVLPLEKQPDGSYSATWQVYDTHTNVYRTTFTAKDSAGNENSITLTWTDPCSGLVHGQDSIISSPCTVGVNQIDGLDTGKVTIDVNTVVTLNSGSKFVWTPAYSIVLSSGSSIRFNGTGSLVNGYLFYTDADGDGYAPNGTYSVSASQSLSGKVRAQSALGTGDCYDSNANAKPGQTSYFTSHRGDGSFDYNCVSGEEKQYTGDFGSLATCDTETAPCEGPGGSIGWIGQGAPDCGTNPAANYVEDTGSCVDIGGGTCDVSGGSSQDYTQSCR